MERSLEIALVRRALAHIDARTTDADDHPTTVATRTYGAEDHARELEKIFRAVPLPIGHVSRIPNAGDFFTHDLAGAPLLVVRGDDGSVQAFLNVCRHRGTRVEGAPCGGAKAFVCPYHAWSYARDGKLLGIPHERGFAGVDRDARGLVRVPTSVAAGLIFVFPSPSATPFDARAWLGPIADDLDGLGIGTSHAHRITSLEKACSWKLAIDVFLEAYHLRPTHRDTIYGMFFDNLGLVDRVGPHLRNVFPKRTIRELATQPEETWSLREHANILFHLFPSTLILVEPDHSAVVHVFPDGPARARLETYMLVPEPPVTEKARAYWAANDAILHNAVAEDFAMGESIQRGVASGANESFVFGAFEHALAHFHAEIARRLD